MPVQMRAYRRRPGLRRGGGQRHQARREWRQYFDATAPRSDPVNRYGQSFEVLDILGVPEDLQMAELFGWKRGAFTGAVKDNPGAISRAEKGTLFLDEIDKLSMRAQAGLLRFIEERLYRMLGDDTSTTRRADVQLLVGPNADLKAAVRSGRFREDLYYRVNVLPVRLPPLAERLDELPKWAGYMLSRCHAESGGVGE